jgi:hypothetical protein
MELEKLCAMQCTDEEIAAFFGVSTKTIERRRKVQRFGDIMEQARAKGRVSVANEVSGPDGRPISIDSRPDLSNLSDEELEQLKSFSEKAQPKRSG